MPKNASNDRKLVVLEAAQFQALLRALQDGGYSTVAPTLKEGAIVYDEVATVDELPVGKTDEHAGGSYRLKTRKDKAVFGYVVGPHSWKKFLHPPTLRLWQVRRNGNGLEFVHTQEQPPKYAFIGVRPCELSAMQIQDKVFMAGEFADPIYQGRRENAFIVAVNCSQAGGTCFCVSMKTGPKAQSGFDLCLTEVVEKKSHFFVVEIGSDRGAALLQDVPHSEATPEHLQKASAAVEQAASQMGKTLDVSDVKDLLYRNAESPHWEDVARRCLGCANCTMVCPTCFCTTVEEVTDLTGGNAERWRKWDSCFTSDFSYVHGGSIRTSSSARYRHWLTHKLAAWDDQFGSSGCVGCGRCITWCPVGIDITAEVQTIRSSETSKPK